MGCKSNKQDYNMEKLKLKKEQFELLSPFEQHFKTAKGDYVRGLYARDVEKMQLVYNQLGYVLSSAACPACVLSMVKVLGEQYYLYKNRYFKDEKHKGEN